MKITFFLLLAFVTVALAIPDGEEEKPKTGTKEVNLPTSTKQTSYQPPTPEEKKCFELIGHYVNETFVGLEVNHDLQNILEKNGGPIGRVNAVWTEKEDAPVKAEDLQKRPLPDAHPNYWIYKYGDSDAQTFIRTEHAVRRFSGTPRAFLEIRGEVYFTPEDFCGKSRKAIYIVDDRGLTFEISREYCSIGQTVSCAYPAQCEADQYGNITSCVAEPYHALLATLVGGAE